MAVSNGKRTFLAGSGGVSAGLLVKLASGKVVKNTATATDEPIGVALGNALENEPVAVRLMNEPGTVEIKAAGAIAQDADVYAAADGEIQTLPATAGSYRPIGKAIKAASGDGAIIEVLPYAYLAAEKVYSSFVAGSGGVAPNLLVKLASGKVVKNTATSTDDPIGVAQGTAAENAAAPVRLLNEPGTVNMVAAGVIAQDADVYAAASGKVQALPTANGTYRRIGKAIEAAGAGDDVIEVLPYDYYATETVSG